MNARQMAAMAEATRLTRQGRLVEATALIQQTLASPAVTRQAPDAPSAAEETSAAPGRHPAAPLALRADSPLTRTGSARSRTAREGRPPGNGGHDAGQGNAGAGKAMPTPRENRPRKGKASSLAERNWRPAAEDVLAAAVAPAPRGRTVGAGRQAQREVPPASGYDGEPLLVT
jgi:hypothetical protein